MTEAKTAELEQVTTEVSDFHEQVRGSDKPAWLEQAGGPVGLAYSGVPVVVFVVANAIGGLSVGVVAALGVAALIAGWRMVRREAVMPAVSGVFGVAVAAFVAYQTGSAKGFFLLGIWTSLLLATVFLVSVLVRRPLVGVLWQLAGGARDWRADRGVLRGYDLATLSLTAVFAARFVVQRLLYDADATGWLAAARITMGYPLLAVALLVSVWAIRRAGARTRISVAQ